MLERSASDGDLHRRAADTVMSTLKLTDLHPFADDADFKSAVAKWRKLAEELEAEGTADAAARLKIAFRHAVAAARPRKTSKHTR